MYKVIVVFLVSFTIVFIPAYGQTAQWQDAKSTHFIVHYQNAPSDFIAKILEKSEGFYDQIATALGFRRYDFWLWENRAVMYIHDNAASFQSATGQPSWSSGAAAPGDKIIQTYVNAQSFFETTLPHEMAHIIFREFVGFNNAAVPRWLDEGVASYQGNLDSAAVDYLISNAMSQNKFIRLENLSNCNPYFMADTDSVNLFYAEGASVVYYLIKEFGKDKFVSFCQALRDKKDLNRAIATSYSFGSVQELGDGWFKYLNK